MALIGDGPGQVHRCIANAGKLGHAQLAAPAAQIYDRMRKAGVEADMITYSALISGCEKSGQYDKALEVLETVQRAGMQATVSNYYNIIVHLGKSGKSEKALEVFISMQMAGEFNSYMHLISRPHS